MALVNKIKKQSIMDLEDIVRFQLIVYCHENKIRTTPSDLDCLTLLGITGEVSLKKFCDQASDKDIFSSPQSVRNAISKAELRGLVVKKGASKKTIKLNDKLNIQSKGNILVDIQYLRKEVSDEAYKSNGAVQQGSSEVKQ